MVAVKVQYPGAFDEDPDADFEATSDIAATESITSEGGYVVRGPGEVTSIMYQPLNVPAGSRARPSDSEA